MKKIAIITGASSGMGKVFAETINTYDTFDEVWVIARRLDRLESLQETVPFPVRPIALDLTDRESFRHYAELLENAQANVQLLVNCSGYGKFQAACRPITTPTATTIFRCAFLSDASRQPIFEKRSEPLQQRRAMIASQNHIVLFLLKFLNTKLFFYFLPWRQAPVSTGSTLLAWWFRPHAS